MIDLLNLEAEREVCSALLFHGRDAWDVIRAAGLEASGFSPEYRGPFRVLASLAERGIRADGASMREAAFLVLERRLADAVEEWSGPLMDSLGMLDTLPHHAGIVADLGRRRALFELATRMATQAVDRSIALGDLVAGGVGEMMAATQVAGKVTGTSDGLWEALEELERCAALNGALPGLSCGIPSIDALLEGFCPGRLVVLAARPGAGKTAFATFLAQQAAADDHEVLFVSLEQPIRQLQIRRLAMTTGLNLFKIKRDPHLWAQHRARVMDAANALKQMPLTFTDAADTATGIALAAQRHSATVGPVKLVVVDYLSWIRFEGKAERNDLGIGIITKRLAKIAKDLDCAVVLLAQLNRESVKDGKSRKPTLADLRDSGAIEQDADQVVLMWEPERGDTPDQYAEEAIVGFEIPKNRHGPLGSCRVRWTKATNRYRDEERYLGLVA